MLKFTRKICVFFFLLHFLLTKRFGVILGSFCLCQIIQLILSFLKVYLRFGFALFWDRLDTFQNELVTQKDKKSKNECFRQNFRFRTLCCISIKQNYQVIYHLKKSIEVVQGLRQWSHFRKMRRTETCVCVLYIMHIFI